MLFIYALKKKWWFPIRLIFIFVFTYSLKRKIISWSNLPFEIAFRSFHFSLLLFEIFPQGKKNERYIGTHERILKVINKYPVFFSKYFKTRNTKFHKTSRLPCTSSERSHPIMVTSSNWSSTSTFFTFFHLLADSRGTWTSRYDSLRRWSVLDLRPPFLTS